QFEAGYEYGPTFQGLRRAWSRGREVFAEVALPEEVADSARHFGLHPALLDAALHASTFCEGQGPTEDGRTPLPFAWNGVNLHASGATALRVRAVPVGSDGVSLQLADHEGQSVAAIDALTLRSIAVDQLAKGTGRSAAGESLFRVEWVPLTPKESAAKIPEGVELLNLTGASGDVRDLTGHVLHVVQDYLADDDRPDGARLAVLTRGAVATASSTELTSPPAAAVWGLIRSAQAEHPHRLVLIDLDDQPASRAALATALTTAIAVDEPQLAIRQGTLAAPRLARSAADPGLAVPEGAEAWRLDSADGSTFEGLTLVPSPEALAPLAPGQVRVAVRAAGLNFRDVLVSLGMVPGQRGIGGEAAGVVLDVGAEVTDLAPGDRVMGTFDIDFGAIGTRAVTDRRLLAPIPRGWSFNEAASVPITFLTAYYGLRDLAGLRAGESVLINAAAGGVGMAAAQLARHFGAEVYGTASPGKWAALRPLGLDDEHLGSSRTTEFRERFLTHTRQRGVDVVVNSLAGEFTDASLDLLPRGGRFLEMGKTDIRDAAEVAAAHPGVVYQAYDLREAGPDRIQQILVELVDLCERGLLNPLPVTPWDVRRAPDAFRHMSQARHVGKVVLTVPRRLDPEGTVLISGAGMIG
ncbi:polyketide synthase dehydratase domain-containing protein, partial [Streptomyces sp. PT12]|uniref:polyketide synthase dehydratase domain-containing protein n=1 Tax=Streptomyces sp. PT12 TaxID=1510197 RepID=UPI000DFE4248